MEATQPPCAETLAEQRLYSFLLLFLFVLGLAAMLFDLWLLSAIAALRVMPLRDLPANDSTQAAALGSGLVVTVLLLRCALFASVGLSAVWLRMGQRWARKMLVGGLVGGILLFVLAAIVGAASGQEEIARQLHMKLWFLASACETLALVALLHPAMRRAAQAYLPAIRFEEKTRRERKR